MSSFTKVTSAACVALSLVIAGFGGHALANESVTGWFTASAVAWMVLLVAACAGMFRTGLFGTVASLFATIVVGRLFSTVHLTAPDAGTANAADPLLLAETGPGIPLLSYLTLALAVVLVLHLVLQVRSGRERDVIVAGVEGWSLAFVRLYAGLMFIPHFAAHIFAGPMPFAIFWKYFGELGFPAPAAMVVLAGVTELAVAVGLSFGFLTRLAAAVGAVYLYLTMLLGNHFPVGYIWILPTGGYEFGIFWAVMCAVFVVAGGGVASLDHWLRQRYPRMPKWLSAILR